MALSNHEWTGKALELLRAGFDPFVEREVKVAVASRRLDGHKLRDYAAPVNAVRVGYQP